MNVVFDSVGLPEGMGFDYQLKANVKYLFNINYIDLFIQLAIK